MSIRLGAVLVGLSLVTIPVTVSAQSPEPAAKLDKNDPNAVRCRRLDETGSLVRKTRVCKTNAEWRAISEQQNRDADDLISRNRAGMNPNG
ncbi:hypothetical protein PMI04_000955 [Sphingobium sp. AP49]|uniref:hypothetical protein n=1 Tax=Sphingobium sp. AP49 TaxID=1144307 RepID=UPI00026EDAD7|nr:hypothetical protein [Sphingobium sp. AP49]WHO39202.1 hypothetical protein PMI04_000955 [Sphingobium sp. AP49]